MELMIGVPTFDGKVCTETMKAIFELDTARFSKTDLEFVKGYDCARARNDICRKALAWGYDYILMVDSDIIVPKYALEELMQCQSGLACGWYKRKRNPELTLAYGYLAGDYSDRSCITATEMEEASDPIRLRGTGMGCALIATHILKYLDTPYFKYVEYPGGSALSEDLYFCAQLRTNGTAMSVHPKVKCGHVKTVIL